MFFGLFSKRAILEFRGPPRSGEEFVMGTFPKAEKLFVKRQPDIIVQLTPIFEPNSCTMVFQERNPFITYKNYGEHKKNKISFINVSDFSIVSNLVDKGYSVINTFCNDSQYVISANAVNYPNFHQINQSFFDQQPKTLYVSTHRNTLCNYQSLNLIQKLKYKVIPFCIIFVILGLISFSVPIPVHSEEGRISEFTIWFTNQFGMPITKRSRKFQNISSQVNEVLKQYFAYGSKREKQLCATLKAVISSPDEYNFYKLIIDEVSMNIYQITILYVQLINDPLDFKATVPGTILKVNGSDDATPVNADLIFRKKQHPIAQFNITVDQQPVTVRLTVGDKNTLPFGRQSMQIYRFNTAHSTLFRTGIKIKASHVSFVQLMKTIYERLDYNALCVYASDGSDVEPIVRFAIPELTEYIDSLIEDYAHSLTENENKGKSFTHGKFRVELTTITIECTVYLVIFAFDASSCIIRSSEATFNAIMSMLISYHHRKLERKADVSSLGRVSTLWSKSQVFALVECIGSPSNFFGSTGTIFGKRIDQQAIDYMLSHTIHQLTWKNIAGKNDFFTQLVSAAWIEERRVWISLTGMRFVDKFRGEQVYTYLVQDITKMFGNGIIDSPEHLEALLAAAWIGFRRITSKDFRIHFRQSITKDLFGEMPPPTFSSLTRQVEKNVLDRYTKSRVYMSHIFSKDGRPVIISSIPNKNNAFYFFKDNALLQALPLCIKEQLEPITEEQNQDTRVILIDIERQTSFELKMPQFHSHSEASFKSWRLPQKLANKPSVVSKLRQIATMMYQKDQEEFLFKISDAFQYGQASFLTRVKMPSFFSLYICNIQLSGNILSIVFLSIVETNRNCSWAAQLSHSMDVLSPTAHIFTWIFEDSESPDCIFSTQPSGQVPARINWTTVKRNVLPCYRAQLTEQFKAKKVDIALQIKFEETRWYILRGKTTKKGTVIGIGLQIPNDVVPSDVRPQRKLQKIAALERAMQRLCDECNADLTLFERRVKEIREEQ